MLKRSFRNYLILIPITLGVLLFSSHVWNPQPVIVPHPLTGFVATTEAIAPVMLLFFLSFLLHDRYEIELSMVCGIKTTKLVVSRVLPIFLYILATTWTVILCHRYTPYASNQYRIRIPIYVPENYKVYLVVSAFVSLLFFASLFLFFRVLTRNCYIPLGLGLLVWGSMSGISSGIRAGVFSPTKCHIDPFISDYFIGDTIPNAMAEHYTDLTSLTNAWTYNRLMFFGLAILLLVATWLLLRREKLHEGLGD
ncbi:MAG: hypothetical protein J6D21_11930 [Clostridia bacterium]|nr:hypothetical protein [Clostridia bacterium]